MKTNFKNTKQKKYGKKSFLLLLLSTLLALVVFFGTQSIVLNLPKVTITTPTINSVHDDIYVSGIVETTSSQDIKPSMPIVTEHLSVQIGDYVSRGDLIATVDVKATQDAILDLASAASLIPEEYTEVLGRMNFDNSLLSSAIPSRIYAPISGTITALSLVQGSSIPINTSACTISQTDELRLKLSLSEEFANNVSVGDTVVFKATATDEQKYVATVTKLFPTASKELNGTTMQTVLQLYAQPNGDFSSLKGGYSVNGVVKKQPSQTYLSIPYEAIMQDDSNKEFVYLLRDNRACKTFIKTGEEFPEVVSVISGIEKDDLVILNPEIIKKDGVRILQQ